MGWMGRDGEGSRSVGAGGGGIACEASYLSCSPTASHATPRLFYPCPHPTRRAYHPNSPNPLAPIHTNTITPGSAPPPAPLRAGISCSSRIVQLLALGSVVLREQSGYMGFYDRLLTK